MKCSYTGLLVTGWQSDCTVSQYVHLPHFSFISDNRLVGSGEGEGGRRRGGSCCLFFFIVYGSWCSPVAWPGSSHRMEVARGPGNTKTKTLNLLKEFMGQTIPNSAPLLWDSFYIFSLNFGDCC